MRTISILMLAVGFITMAAVSYDTNNPNETIEEELKKLNSNMERLISVSETRLSYINEMVNMQNKILNKIFLSLQPNAYDMNGELVEDEN